MISTDVLASVFLDGWCVGMALIFVTWLFTMPINMIRMIAAGDTSLGTDPS
jgi:hypothetical protein